MGKKQKNKQASNQEMQRCDVAIGEAIHNHTVVLVAEQHGKPYVGTGTLITLSDRLFILTCKHVVKKGKLLFSTRAGANLKLVEREEIKKKPVPLLIKNVDKATLTEPPIVNKYLSKDDEDDIALLELDISKRPIKDHYFFGLSRQNVKAEERERTLYVLGYAAELARQVDSQTIGYFSSYFSSVVSNKKGSYQNYNQKKHFLIEYPLVKEPMRLHGISGAGIWMRHAYNDGCPIWTANPRLVGLQTSVYPDSRVIKAIKIEVLFSFLDSLGIKYS